MNFLKTKKGKIQFFIMTLSLLVILVSSILLGVFNSKECNYNNEYLFEYSDTTNNISMKITLNDDNTYDAVLFNNGELDIVEGSFYILKGSIFFKPSSSSSYNYVGKISYYSMIRETNDATLPKMVFECTNSTIKINKCIALFIVSSLSFVGIIIWMIIENKLNKKKKALNSTEENTLIENK